MSYLWLCLCPPRSGWTLRNAGTARRATDPQALQPAPDRPIGHRLGREIRCTGWKTPISGHDRFDPADLRHDMHVNIVTFRPAAASPPRPMMNTASMCRERALSAEPRLGDGRPRD